jgi:hypothetical protein
MLKPTSTTSATAAADSTAEPNFIVVVAIVDHKDPIVIDGGGGCCCWEWRGRGRRWGSDTFPIVAVADAVVVTPVLFRGFQGE